MRRSLTLILAAAASVPLQALGQQADPYCRARPDANGKYTCIAETRTPRQAPTDWSLWEKAYWKEFLQWCRSTPRGQRVDDTGQAWDNVCQESMDVAAKCDAGKGEYAKQYRNWCLTMGLAKTKPLGQIATELAKDMLERLEKSGGNGPAIAKSAGGTLVKKAVTLTAEAQFGSECVETIGDMMKDWRPAAGVARQTIDALPMIAKAIAATKSASIVIHDNVCIGNNAMRESLEGENYFGDAIDLRWPLNTIFGDGKLRCKGVTIDTAELAARNLVDAIQKEIPSCRIPGVPSP